MKNKPQWNAFGYDVGACQRMSKPRALNHLRATAEVGGRESSRLAPFCHNTTVDEWCASKEGWVRSAGVESHWLTEHISRLWKRLRHDPLVLSLCSICRFIITRLFNSPHSFHRYTDAAFQKRPNTYCSEVFASWLPEFHLKYTDRFPRRLIIPDVILSMT